MHFEERPLLVEPRVKNFLKNVLHDVHAFKINYYTLFFNMSLIVLFLTILFAILYFKYKGKPTKEELEFRRRQKEQFIFSRIKNYKENKEKQHQDMLTCLPRW